MDWVKMGQIMMGFASLRKLNSLLRESTPPTMPDASVRCLDKVKWVDPRSVTKKQLSTMLGSGI